MSNEKPRGGNGQVPGTRRKAVPIAMVTGPAEYREVAWPVDQRPLAFICGPTPFVETAAASLVELGHEPGRIKTERFGPTGET